MWRERNLDKSVSLPKCLSLADEDLKSRLNTLKIKVKKAQDSLIKQYIDENSTNSKYNFFRSWENPYKLELKMLNNMVAKP